VDVCGTPAVTGTAVVGDGSRTATLKADGDSVTLKMVNIDNGGVTKTKKWLKESCTFVVKS